MRTNTKSEQKINHLYLLIVNNKYDEAYTFFKEANILKIKNLDNYLFDVNNNLLIKATNYKSYKIVNDLIVSKKINLNHQNYWGLSSLHLLIQDKNYELIDLILKNGANLFTGVNENTKTSSAIHRFTIQSDIDILQIFLKYVTNLNDLNLLENEITNVFIKKPSSSSISETILQSFAEDHFFPLAKKLILEKKLEFQAPINDIKEKTNKI